jgi:hypothetical protein
MTTRVVVQTDPINGSKPFSIRKVDAAHRQGKMCFENKRYQVWRIHGDSAPFEILLNRIRALIHVDRNTTFTR